MVLIVNPRLQGLLQRSLPNITVIAKVTDQNQIRALSGIDYHCPLASAMQYLSASSYLTPLTLHPRDHIAPRIPRATGQLAIGISWHSQNTLNGHQRSIELSHWLPLLSTHQQIWVNLQAGKHHKALKRLERNGVRLLREETCQPLGDLDAFAAWIKRLDLVITIDNSTAHIAASLGVPTWILLPNDAEWRWGIDAHQCAWYPSVRLFRAVKPNDWQPVLRAVAQALTTITPRDDNVRRKNKVDN